LFFLSATDVDLDFFRFLLLSLLFFWLLLLFYFLSDAAVVLYLLSIAAVVIVILSVVVDAIIGVNLYTANLRNCWVPRKCDVVEIICLHGAILDKIPITRLLSVPTPGQNQQRSSDFRRGQATGGG